jgi:hypothetical protein
MSEIGSYATLIFGGVSGNLAFLVVGFTLVRCRSIGQRRFLIGVCSRCDLSSFQDRVVVALATLALKTVLQIFGVQSSPR